ncbi:MAG: carbohydrate binding family 9 domain-containing protein [Saprospiraceae bacterium]|nr:carbohydrate binding family 9 domain-containing protein [Saprospiraceae bacterium]
MLRQTLLNAMYCSLVVMATMQLSFGQSSQQAERQGQYALHIQATSEPVVIDGKLDDAAWQSAEVADNFWMSFPVDDRAVDAKYQTQIRMAYDDQFLYVSAVCMGPGPYVIQTLKRDASAFWDGDVFGLTIDPNNQGQSAFNFNTNPSGVQFDALISGQTGLRNGGGSSSGFVSAWDNKWYCQSKIHADRWITEMAIPFRTLRYDRNTEWGINFHRGVSADNSWHSWAPVPIQFMVVDLGYTGKVIWDNPPPVAKGNISFIPYALGSTAKNFQDDTPADQDFRMGADAKVALSSNLNLDLTLNPDFSQVDVDEQVTNLTTVNIRFPERRLFFLENSDLFSDFGIPPMRPFFSRRIGLDEDGAPIPILYGARLSGNLSPDLRVGLMNLQTKVENQTPGQNYTSVALHQRVLARSTLKGYFHNRQAYHSGEFQVNDYNRVGGLEFDYRTQDNKWRAFAGYGKSWSNGKSTDNYFYNVAVGYNGRKIAFYTNWAGVGNNYRPDMGFIPRIQHFDDGRDTTLFLGFHHNYTRFSYTILPKNEKINNHIFSINDVLDFTKDGNRLIGNRLRIGYEINWANSSSFEVEATHRTDNLLYPFIFTEGEPLPTGKYTYQEYSISYQSDMRKVFNYEIGSEFGGFYNGTRWQYRLDLNYRRQPWGAFTLSFEQNRLNFPDPYTDDDLFLIGPKIEINFSRNIFWTTFLQYNTQRDNFNINSRFQWRFQPMSDIFLVYSDNYAIEQWGPKTRALVLKMNYWFNL